MLQCLVASSSDESFLAVTAKLHTETQDFAIPKLSHTSFIIRHSAGTVEYEVECFLDKNKDQLYPDLVEMLSSSSLPLIKTLFTEPQDQGKGQRLASAAKAARAAGAGKASQVWNWRCCRGRVDIIEALCFGGWLKAGQSRRAIAGKGQ